MKKLLLVLAATAACMAFAGSAKAQTTNIYLPSPVFYFEQAPPASLPYGGYVVLRWAYTNYSETSANPERYGQLAKDMLGQAMSQPGVSGKVGVAQFEIQANDGQGHLEGWVKLAIAPNQGDIHFPFQSVTIQTY